MDNATLRPKSPARPNPSIETRPLADQTSAAPAAFQLSRRTDGRLWIMADDFDRPVRVRRCFPWSEPSRFLSLCDEDNAEVAFVAEPAALDRDSRAALEDVLVEAGFVFNLLEVFEIDEEVELRYWKVRTAQGNRSFQTRLDDWPRQLPDGALLIRDVAGDLYRLVAHDELSKRSRELLWSFVD